MDVAGYFLPGVGKAFHPLAPARVLDSSFSGPGNLGGYVSPWGASTTRMLSVSGVGGVPSGADSVVTNMTVTDTTASSFLTVWPQGARPTVSSLNWATGVTIPNAVTVKLSAGGQLAIFNSVGQVDVICDVSGYYG